jgi:hypothetical protein
MAVVVVSSSRTMTDGMFGKNTSSKFPAWNGKKFCVDTSSSPIAPAMIFQQSTGPGNVGRGVKE